MKYIFLSINIFLVICLISSDSLAIDKNDDVYVTGGTNSSDFPTTTNSYQSSYQDSIRADAFITKISSNGCLLYTSPSPRD